MTLRGLYPYGGALTRPVTIPFKNRVAQALARSALGAPERGAGSPNGLTEGFSRSVDEQTPPVSLTLNHLPFQGRQGHFVPADHKDGDAYNIIYKLFTHAIVVAALPNERHNALIAGKGGF